MPNFHPMGGVGDVAASHHAAFSKKQAVESGLPLPELRKQVDRQAIRRIAPNVLAIHGAPVTWEQRLMAATLTANQAGTASHRSGCRLHDVDGFDNGDLIEVTVPRGRRILMPGVIVHQAIVTDGDVVELNGIRVTHLARTLVDLANVAGPRSLERALDDFQRRGHSLTWLELVASAAARPGVRGPNLILAEVERRRSKGAVRGSWFEKLIQEAITSPKLPEPVPQYVVRDDDGEFIARVDLAFPTVKLGVEAHSRSFHSGPHAELLDQRRENRAMLAGWQFLYLGWADRKTPAQARAYLERLVARRSRDLGVPI